MLIGKVLSDVQLSEVRDASEEILERTGCRVLDAQALALCRKAGARVEDANGTVRIPRSLLRELVARAPSRFKATGVDGITREIGGGRQWGMAITNDPWIIDYDSREPRRPRTEDIRRNTIVAQSLDRIAGMSCMDFPVSDAPAAHANLRALEVHLLHHAKHNFVYPASVASLQRWLKIGAILARGGELRASGLFSVGVAALTPLTVTDMNVEFVRICCDHGFAIVPTVCPTAGMTSPYTLAGTLALANAASVELGKSYGLPVTAECGGTMVHRFDQQSGAEGMLFMLAAVASGADCLAGFGSTHNAVGHSTEMMLIQEAYWRAAEFLRRGIRTDGERRGAESAARVGPGGEYMTDPLTLEHLRGDEFFSDELFDHDGDSAHSRSMLERAHAKVQALVEGFPSPVPDSVREELQAFFRQETR